MTDDPFPFEDALFRHNLGTGLDEKMCPKCLAWMDALSSKCGECNFDEADYDASTFWGLRKRFISPGPPPVRTGFNAPTGNAADLLFESQWSIWSHIRLSADYLNRFAMNRVTPADVARAFLRAFPLSHRGASVLAAGHFQFQTNLFTCEDIEKTLMLIQQFASGIFDDLADEAYTTRMFLASEQGQEEIDLMDSLALRYGVVNGTRVEEDDPESVRRSLAWVIFPKTDSLVESTLHPLHFKNLVIQKRGLEPKPRVSSERVAKKFDLWRPQTEQQEAWKSLALRHFGGQKGEKAKAYFEKQLTLTGPERDINFLISHSLIDDAFDEVLLPEDARYTEYYCPLFSFYKDQGAIEHILSGPENLPLLDRTVYFFDFKKHPGLVPVVGRRLAGNYPDSRLAKLLPRTSDVVRQAGFEEALHSMRFDRASTFLLQGRLSSPSDPSLWGILTSHPPVLGECLDNDGFSSTVPEDRLLGLLQVLNEPVALRKAWWALDFRFRQNNFLESRPENAREILAGTLFDTQNVLFARDEGLSNEMLQQLSMFAKFAGPRRLLIRKIVDQLMRPDVDRRATLHRYLQGAVFFRESPWSDIVADRAPAPLFDALLRILTTDKDHASQNFCERLVIEAFEADGIDEPTVLAFWKNADKIIDSYVRTSLKEKLANSPAVKNIQAQATPAPEKPARFADPMNKPPESDELSAAIRQKDLENDIARKNVAALQQAVGASLEYQTKMLILQGRYQAELSTAMSLTDIAERTSRLMAAAEHYKKECEDLSLWLARQQSPPA